MALFTLESQPNFPSEDLTDANAALLEILLANRDVLDQAHHAAEKTSLLFRVGHRAIVANTSLFIEHDTQLEAVSNGIAKYEVIAMTVNLDHVMHTHNPTEALAYFMNGDPTLDYLTLVGDTRDAFTAEMPRTKTVIEESSPSHLRPYRDYMLAGAALARMAEIDVTHDAI